VDPSVYTCNLSYIKFTQRKQLRRPAEHSRNGPQQHAAVFTLTPSCLPLYKEQHIFCLFLRFIIHRHHITYWFYSFYVTTTFTLCRLAIYTSLHRLPCSTTTYQLHILYMDYWITVEYLP